MFFDWVGFIGKTREKACRNSEFPQAQGWRYFWLEEDSCPELNPAIGKVAAASKDLSEVGVRKSSCWLAEIGEMEVRHGDLRHLRDSLDLERIPCSQIGPLRIPG